MTPEERNMLERTLKISQENNDLLGKINRRARNAQLFRVVYWIVIIGLSFGAYYFIQPYLNLLTNELGYLNGSSGSSSTSTNNIQNIQNFMKTFNR